MELYGHIEILIGILLGLGLTHLLQGIARLIEHPRLEKIYWVHILWTLFLFLYLIHSWWWEFRLKNIAQWTFPDYLFICLYVVLLYLLCTVLYPESLTDYANIRHYFYSRRPWIFGLLSTIFCCDILDTILKGSNYLQHLGISYDLRTGALIVLSLAACKVKNPRFHAAFAIFAVVSEIVFIALLYRTLA